MGICAKCIYRGETKVNKRPKPCHDIRNKRFFNPNITVDDFYCLNEENADVDYITGQVFQGSCRAKNSFGECLLFDDGSVDFFA